MYKWSNANLLTFTGEAEWLPNISHDELSNRIIGSLFGSALGEIIGLYTHGISTPEQCTISYPDQRFSLDPEPTQFCTKRIPEGMERVRWYYGYGQWADATDQMILLLLSVIHEADRAPPHPAHFARRLKIYKQNGLVALGQGYYPSNLDWVTKKVVSDPSFEHNPMKAAIDVYNNQRQAAERKEEDVRLTVSNGAVVRTGVLGLITLWLQEKQPSPWKDPVDPVSFKLGSWEGTSDIAIISDLTAKTTHADPACILSCRIVTRLTRACLRGQVKHEQYVHDIVAKTVEEFPEISEGCMKRLWEQTAELDQLDLASKEDPVDHTYTAVASGIFCLREAIKKLKKGPVLVEKEEVFEDLITDLVMRGGAAKDNACMAGGILGAFLGYTTLPRHWKNGVKNGDWLMDKGEALLVGKPGDATATDGGDKNLVAWTEVAHLWNETRAQTRFLNAIRVKEEKESEEEENKKKEKKAKWGNRRKAVFRVLKKGLGLCKIVENKNIEKEKNIFLRPEIPI
ncbi:ADP-ribosylglycohydrolase-domain-containing protein [Podospora fimiseda]|uniref:ADP-ribosylglycohydrolase-domain-containing protein n=1 Tax=Podospora fimiseda TaxID=252190 RepID=A0AAN7GU45_9PEZI|nr:ADP-ribosylglycohydrolase-domain-containing protein [Podospora fimiseda]